MSLFSRNDVRERDRQSRLSTADLAAMDTQPGDQSAAGAPGRAAETVVEPPDVRRDTAAMARTTVPDDVEDAVEKTVTPERRAAEARERPAALDAQHLAPLFHADAARDFRARWDAAQIGFVDDPRQAVKQADELVAQVMQSLAKSFADERTRLEAQMDDTASTENLRVALQRYRSFFQRLLSL
jgi:hypothetical protein